MKLSIKIYVMDDSRDYYIVSTQKAAITVPDGTVRTAEKLAPELTEGIVALGVEEYLNYLDATHQLEKEVEMRNAKS